MARVIYVDRSSFSGPNAVRAAIAEAVAIASGRTITRVGSADVSKMLAIMGGNAILAEVSENYVKHSRGEPGVFAPAWTPLLPATVERRMRRNLRAFAGTDAMAVERRMRRDRYRALVAAERARLRAGTTLIIPAGVQPAERQRMRRQWYRMLERQVAITVGQFPHELHRPTAARTHPFALALMLRDTGVMFASLTPGYVKNPKGTAKSDAKDQHFEAVPGVFAVGTKVPYAKWHLFGTGADGRVIVPARPFMPTDGSVPAAWMESARRAVSLGVAGTIRWLLKGGTFDP